MAEETPLPLALMVMDRLLTREALLAAFRLIVPELPVPGWVYVAVTPLGRLLVESVTLPAKLLRVRLTVRLALPPRASVTELELTLLIAMVGVVTVRVKVAVAETPLPLAVMVMDRLLTRVALLAAFRLMVPELPVPGWVYVAATPLGRPLVESATLPVKLLRVRLTVRLCALPPRTSVNELGLTLLIAMVGVVTVRVKVAVAEETPLPPAVMVICLLPALALLAACNLMLPEFPEPGCVNVAVTPLSKVLVESVMPPVKLLRVRLTVRLCALPPRSSVIELGFTLLTAMLGVGVTVRLKVAVAETPLPLAVMVIWVLPVAAPPPACRLMLPEFPEPGEVMVAVTPLGGLLVESVTLPVKLVRVRLTVRPCALPP